MNWTDYSYLCLLYLPEVSTLFFLGTLIWKIPTFNHFYNVTGSISLY